MTLLGGLFLRSWSRSYVVGFRGSRMHGKTTPAPLPRQQKPLRGGGGGWFPAPRLTWRGQEPEQKLHQTGPIYLLLKHAYTYMLVCMRGATHNMYY